MLSAKELDALEGINRKFRELMSDPDNVNEAANFLVDDLIDELTIGVVFEVHRSAKLGVLEPEADMSGEDINKSVDIFLIFLSSFSRIILVLNYLFNFLVGLKLWKILA